MKKEFIILIGTLLFLLIIGFTAYFTSELTRDLMFKSAKLTSTEIVYDINDSYSEQKVRDYLIELKVKYPEVAVAQMKLESANGTSNIFRQNNNLFGMKVPGKRPTTALGTKNNHAYYSHWRQSCIDYALYQAYFMNADNISSEKDWLDFIGQMYAEDQNYKQKLVARIGYDNRRNQIN